jgi:sirohydrochlorin cobaltochelatase
MSKPAVLLCGHGSRDPEAIAEFEQAAAALRARLANRAFATGYLEFARPTIGEALAGLQGRGAPEILAIPGMLFAASHVKNDLPWEMNSFMNAHPGAEVKLGRDLGIDPHLLEAAADRIAAVAPAEERGDSLLVVVGRGTNDPDANANISKVARMLWEGMRFGWTEVCYSGVAYPLVDEGLRHAVRLGYRRIIVFPYFLFAGILVDRIYGHADACQAAHPEIEIVKADYLNDHPLVIDTFVARLGEVQNGANLMNCLLCKYREQVLGYEADQGAPQVGHHFHVRGIDTDADHSHAHEHGHHHHEDGHDYGGHPHAHHHSPQPPHPLAPLAPSPEGEGLARALLRRAPSPGGRGVG